MAFIQCKFSSRVLQSRVAINVILPAPYRWNMGLEGSEIKKKNPCLYLLHGLSDDQAFFQRATLIEPYVAGTDLVVVMPACDNSMYADMVHGNKYWTYLSEELPEVIASFFQISEKREDTFAAGFSMGGYGAFKLGLQCPERFAAVASISGVLDLAEKTAPGMERVGNYLDLAFGEGVDIRGTDDDLLALAEKKAGAGQDKLPKFYQCCGTEDPLYGQNVKFRDHARKLGLDLTYDDGPGGHTWEFINPQLQQILKWLPIK